MNFQPADIAKECSVSVNTIRKWCQDYAEFLSPGATVEDAPRILTDRDLSVLREVSQLRKEKHRYPAIVLRLREINFGEVEPSPAPIVEAPQEPQERPQTVLVALQPILTRLDTIERTQQSQERNRRDVWTAFAVGVIVAGLFFLIIVLLMRPG